MYKLSHGRSDKNAFTLFSKRKMGQISRSRLKNGGVRPPNKRALASVCSPESIKKGGKNGVLGGYISHSKA
jgi:hypothetical protein